MTGEPHDADRDGIWVSSDLNPDGTATYIVTVTAGPDVALSLKADAAIRYVAAVHRAAAIAQHDAAVMRQLTGVGGLGLDPTAAAAYTVADMRADREPVQVAATSPLKFEPIVAARDMAGYVVVWAGTRRISQWTPADCFQHAGHVMQVLAGVDLDSAYYRYLVHAVGLDPNTARGAVDDLGNHGTGLRDDEPSVEP